MAKYEAEVVSDEFVSENRTRRGRPCGDRDVFWDAFVDGQWRAVTGNKVAVAGAARNAARTRGMTSTTHRLTDGRVAVRFVPLVSVKVQEVP